MTEAITSPDPIPIKMDATKNNTDVLRNISPTPTPIRVVPPMAQELLSLLFSTSNSSFFIRPHIAKDQQHKKPNWNFKAIIKSRRLFVSAWILLLTVILCTILNFLHQLDPVGGR